MMLRLRSLIRHVVGPCAFALVAIHASAACSQSSFSPMAGAWSGTGVIELRSGTQERVRCKANYVAESAGQSVKLDLRCASDTYKFELSSTIVQDGTSLSGFWYESTHRIGGKISGRSTGGQIEARAEGDIVTALLTVKTDGNSQTFLMESPGSQVEQVSIELHR
jgi:hypothetical protein